MKRVIGVTALILVVVAGSTFAFDGKRKGFVLGGGLGLGLDSKYDADIAIPFEDNGVGIGLQFVIGGAFDDKNMLVYEGNVTGWHSDLVDVNITQGFNGAAWYHYYGQPGRSAFTTVGLGFYVFQAEDFDQNDAGAAILLGGGYEFSRHWQVGVYISGGKTSDFLFDYNHTHFSVLVSGIAF